MNGHPGRKLVPTHGPPPDYTGARCITHPESWLWDIDASIAKDKAKTINAVRANKQVAQAKAICGYCSLIDVCLTQALVEEDGRSGFARNGVRGGMDRYERAAVPSETTEPEVQGHGTPARYQAHMRAKERACDPCRAANTAVKVREYAVRGNITSAPGTRRVS